MPDRPAIDEQAENPGTGDRSAALDASAVEVWLFDLDNTLYPASNNIFDQIDRRMGGYIQRLLGLDAEAAKALQKRYFQDHGTTLRGLMENHGADPVAYLDYVHRIDLSGLRPDTALDRGLAALPGRKLIFTNASQRHAERVLARLEIGHHFEAVFDIACADYRPKPAPEAYRRLIDAHRLAPRRTVFIEDSARNLAPAAALGMTTVWVKSATRWAGDGAAAGHVDHVVEDLGAWLGGLAAPPPERR